GRHHRPLPGIGSRRQGAHAAREPAALSGRAMAENRSAVILLSGGLDSATVLAIARAEGWACHALSVDYGQRHRAELDAAARVAKALGAVAHRVVRVDIAGFG